MSDLLIRDVPEEVLAALDKHAVRLGLSRTEYIRRRLAQDAHTAAVNVTTADWRRIADDFAGLGDSEVMGQAWQ